LSGVTIVVSISHVCASLESVETGAVVAAYRSLRERNGTLPILAGQEALSRSRTRICGHAHVFVPRLTLVAPREVLSASWFSRCLRDGGNEEGSQ
jgi:hypothetical protein